jgi:hypothetical protein
LLRGVSCDPQYSVMFRYDVYSAWERSFATLIINPRGIVEKVIIAGDGQSHVLDILTFFMKLDAVVH